MRVKRESGTIGLVRKCTLTLPGPSGTMSLRTILMVLSITNVVSSDGRPRSIRLLISTQKRLLKTHTTDTLISISEVLTSDSENVVSVHISHGLGPNTLMVEAQVLEQAQSGVEKEGRTERTQQRQMR